MKGFFSKFMLLAAFCAVLRLLFSPTALEKAQAALRELGESKTFASAVLGSELPGIEVAAETVEAAADAAVISGESAEPGFVTTPLKNLVLQTAAPRSELFYEPLPVPGAENLSIKNKTSYKIDVSALLTEPLSYTLKTGTPQVLIIHTHGSEAYSQAGGEYVESDDARTLDKTKNVVQVGNVLAGELAARGITVLHDTELYDHPSYSGSYSRSLAAVEEYLRKYPTVKVVIDLHRDSADDANGNAYRTEYVSPDGSVSSQVMLISATGEAGLAMPDWQENMKLALRLQARMEDLYPGLARPLMVSDQRYNQHAAPGYLLAEIGTDGNTLAEAETAARFFAECMADVLGKIIE